MIGGAGVLPGSKSVAPLFSLRLLRTRGLDEYGPYRGVCRLATPGFPFEWRAGVLEGLGSWGRGGRVSRGTLVVVSCLLFRPLDDQTHRGAEASFWGLSIGGSRASLGGELGVSGGGGNAVFSFRIFRLRLLRNKRLEEHTPHPGFFARWLPRILFFFKLGGWGDGDLGIPVSFEYAASAS